MATKTKKKLTYKKRANGEQLPLSQEEFKKIADSDFEKHVLAIHDSCKKNGFKCLIWINKDSNSIASGYKVNINDIAKASKHFIDGHLKS